MVFCNLLMVVSVDFSVKLFSLYLNCFSSGHVFNV